MGGIQACERIVMVQKENESELINAIKQMKKRLGYRDRKNQQVGEHNQRWFRESFEF